MLSALAFPYVAKSRPLTPVTASTKRVLSLRDPSAKMSKSAPDPASRILLTDPPAMIQKKIRGAVTDSIVGITYDPVARPGAANLLSILAACTGEDVHKAAARYADKGHGDLKKDVAEAVTGMLNEPRKEYERLRGETGYLEEVAREGARRARERSALILAEVRRRVGLA